jgi:tRNA pseudouridine38-40 synthase
VRNIKLVLEYDGTDFVGWQRQPNGRSVQGEIEKALLQLIQEKVNVIGAGRTDSGVHARGQVANFRSNSDMDIKQINRGLVAIIPEDVSIVSLEETSLDFHARYSAKSRTYSYLITTSPSALLRKYSWFVKYSLDVKLLEQCAASFVGVHDFEYFCKDDSDVNNFMCNVSQSFWTFNQNILRFQIQANRFLHSMVRLLMGTMIDVARGYISIDVVDSIFINQDRSKPGFGSKRSGQVAPAKGLILESIQY